MFHNFLRIPQIARSSYSVLHGNRVNRRLVLTNVRRLYSNDSSKKPPEDSKTKVKEKVNICVTSRKNPYDVCKPGTRRPCIPSPPPHNIGPRRCPGPSQMDMLPKPACPWDPEYVDRNKKFMKHLIMGLVFTALSLLALWYGIETTKKVDTKVDTSRKVRKKCRIPKCGSEIPDSVPYLLIGGGTASFSAFRAIKSNDPTAKVLVVSNECFFPYMRPPLSKEIWLSDDKDVADKLVFKQWNGTERSIFYEPEDFYVPVQDLKDQPNGGVSVLQGWEVKKIDVVERIAYLDDDTQIKYDKCLIATGARAKKMDILKNASDRLKERLTVFRDIFDFQYVYDKLPEIKCIAIIGGGFLGSELACALGKISFDRDIQVFQIFKENGNMGKVLPEYLSEWTTQKVRQEGVTIIKKTSVDDATVNERNKVVLHLDNGNKLVVDHVITAIGVEPNTDLAKTSDLEVDPEYGGFLVNAEMEARSNLYIAGDCSCFYDIKLGRRRVEHHDHAVVSGRLAGENMTGAMKPYVHQSMFWSDLGPNIGYEAIGLVDSKLPTVAVFAKAGSGDSPKAVVTATDNNLRSATEEQAGQLKVQQVSLNQGDVEDTSSERERTPTSKKEDYGKGIIFYLRDDIVVGIVLWNVFNRMPIARQVLADERKYDDLNEVAKLFNIHED